MFPYMVSCKENNERMEGELWEQFKRNSYICNMPAKTSNSFPHDPKQKGMLHLLYLLNTLHLFSFEHQNKSVLATKSYL